MFDKLLAHEVRPGPGASLSICQVQCKPKYEKFAGTLELCRDYRFEYEYLRIQDRSPFLRSSTSRWAAIASQSGAARAASETLLPTTNFTPIIHT